MEGRGHGHKDMYGEPVEHGGQGDHADHPEGESAMDHREGSRLLGNSSSLEGGSWSRERASDQSGDGDLQQGGSTGPKPYAGAHSGPSTGSSGHMTSSSYTSRSGVAGSGRYVGMGKIAKQMGVDVQQLRSCAQSQGIVPDKQQRSCDMFSQEKAGEIMQACGTGFKAS